MTARYPAPPANDGEPHVYVSVGHQQMMTDAMTPLGLSMWQLVALRPMVAAGGRLFVDVTAGLASPTIRAAYLGALGASDPLVRDALQAVIDRGGIVNDAPPGDAPAGVAPAGVAPAGVSPPPPLPTDPAIVTGLVERTQASLASLASRIVDADGERLFDLVLADLAELKVLLAEPESMQAIMAGFDAAAWLNAHIEDWLGDPGAADALALSAPGNVTSDMGLALLDVADAIRPFAEVIAYLDTVVPGTGAADVFGPLAHLAGGSEAARAIAAYLSRYGMRCVGEIDIARPRWSEEPSALLPALLAHVRHAGPGAAAQRVEDGLRRADVATRSILSHLRALPEGDTKANETERMIERLRTFVGYREYPKYGIVCRLFLYKQALLREADRLVSRGTIDERDDVYFLTFDEFAVAARSGAVDRALVARRRAEFRAHQALVPPRVLLSTGEAIDGPAADDPAGDDPAGDDPPGNDPRGDDGPRAGRLRGLGVSSGIVEGRARVVASLDDAHLEPGDILVTTHTDPGWTPLFVGLGGLVTEVGGRLTHGAVVAREYGLAAVVAVVGATELIPDGATIRIDGTTGLIEIR